MEKFLKKFGIYVLIFTVSIFIGIVQRTILTSSYKHESDRAMSAKKINSENELKKLDTNYDGYVALEGKIESDSGIVYTVEKEYEYKRENGKDLGRADFYWGSTGMVNEERYPCKMFGADLDIDNIEFDIDMIEMSYDYEEDKPTGKYKYEVYKVNNGQFGTLIAKYKDGQLIQDNMKFYADINKADIQSKMTANMLVSKIVSHIDFDFVLPTLACVAVVFVRRRKTRYGEVEQVSEEELKEMKEKQFIE